MQSATLQMSLADYQKLHDDRTKAELEAATARAELASFRLMDPSGLVAPLTAFARDCLTIAQFAVANLPPEMNRGWPYEALKRICANIDALPDCSTNDRDMALDVLNFAKDCETHEIRRRNEPKPTKMTPEDVEAHRTRLENDPVAEAIGRKMQAT